MLKYQPPMNRFAAVDYETIDSIDDMIVKGLLVTLIRQKPGEDMTIEKLSTTHKQGRKTLESAMRTLVEMGLVVKLKIQSVSGNRWRTVFTVSDRPISPDFITEWMESITDARSIRVEPEHLDPRKNGEQAPIFPTAEIGPVGDGNEKDQVSEGDFDFFPTAAPATVGAATLAGAAAKEEKVFTQYGGDEVAKKENTLRAPHGEDALPGDERVSGGRPSIEEIAGPGSDVAREVMPGHGGSCDCPKCRVARKRLGMSIPQQPSGPGVQNRQQGQPVADDDWITRLLQGNPEVTEQYRNGED